MRQLGSRALPLHAVRSLFVPSSRGFLPGRVSLAVMMLRVPLLRWGTVGVWVSVLYFRSNARSNHGFSLAALVLYQHLEPNVLTRQESSFFVLYY